MMQRVQYTRIGYELLSKKLAQLKGKDRREIALDIESSRVHGDIRESIDYADAKERQGMLEARIRVLEDQLRSVEIVDTSMIHDRFVNFGCMVRIENIETAKILQYQIVGEFEADLALQKISITAPISQALLGKEVGDIIMIELERGIQEWEVLEISTPK